MIEELKKRVPLDEWVKMNEGLDFLISSLTHALGHKKWGMEETKILALSLAIAQYKSLTVEGASPICSETIMAVAFSSPDDMHFKGAFFLKNGHTDKARDALYSWLKEGWEQKLAGPMAFLELATAAIEQMKDDFPDFAIQLGEVIIEQVNGLRKKYDDLLSLKSADAPEFVEWAALQGWKLDVLTDCDGKGKLVSWYRWLPVKNTSGCREMLRMSNKDLYANYLTQTVI